jgi:hypothetical protein
VNHSEGVAIAVAVPVCLGTLAVVVVTRLVRHRGPSEDRSVGRTPSQRLGPALAGVTLFGLVLDHSPTLTRPPVLGTSIALLLATMWIPGIGVSRMETSTAVRFGAIIYTFVGLMVTVIAVLQPGWRLLPAAVFDVLAGILWTRTIVGRRQQT